MSSKKSIDIFKKVVAFAQKSPGFHSVTKHVQIIGGGDGHLLAEFVVQPEDVNGFGGLHGGLTATIIDNFTTYALVSNDCKPGLSVDLHISYLFGARIGDTVVVNAKTVKVGKTLANLECELRHKNSGKIIAKGTQTRYIASDSEPNIFNTSLKSTGSTDYAFEDCKKH